MILETAIQHVACDFELVKDRIQADLDCDIPLVNNLAHHLVDQGGKRLRPLIVLLAARAVGYEGKAHIDLAVSIEYFHNATLLHDDVIDESNLRRGVPSANAVWGSKASVLVGDYLFSRAFQLMNRCDHLAVLKVLANTANTITRGEVLQLTHAYQAKTSEEDYIKIIDHKTGALFAAAAQVGALLAEEPQAHVDALVTYGSKLGSAFQMIDDALDYTATSEDWGKNLGDDLSEGKLTLPLIYAMQKSDGKTRGIIEGSIEKGSHDHLETILSAIESSDAIAYTQSRAGKLADEAKDALAILPTTVYRDSLIALCDFAIKRKS